MTVQQQATDEAIRQLRAARDLRYGLNEHGRYVISNEPRPERKTREKLMRYGWLDWRWAKGQGAIVGLQITTEGMSALRNLEAADHA